jgi:hypothetical protein
VSPDGAKVFVTGRSARKAGSGDYATVAYNAATGARLWVARYNGPGNGEDNAASVAVSPSGTTVFVTGASKGSRSGSDYATVAYATATGAQLWVKRYNGEPPRGVDQASSLSVSPDGQMVVVTGQSGSPNGNDYITIAYNAATGTRLWGSRYSGPGYMDDNATAVKVSPDGSTVLVTGSSYGSSGTDPDWATVAYSAATGAQLWAKRYNGPGHGYDVATALAIDPTGTRVFVTGLGAGKTGGQDCTTIAYRAATGSQLWLKRYSGPANLSDSAASDAASPDGAKVFITGISHGGATLYDYVTIGYDAATGAWLWGKRYNGPSNLQDAATAVVASATRVIVTGAADIHEGAHSYSYYTTIAYTP